MDVIIPLSYLANNCFPFGMSQIANLFQEPHQLIHRADSAAIAITTTDLVSKSVAIESEVRAVHFSCVEYLGEIEIVKHTGVNY